VFGCVAIGEAVGGGGWEVGGEEIEAAGGFEVADKIAGVELDALGGGGFAAQAGKKRPTSADLLFSTAVGMVEHMGTGVRNKSGFRTYAGRYVVRGERNGLKGLAYND
jgi:hypothetical protein